MLFKEIRNIIPVIEVDTKQTLVNYLTREYTGKDENGIENIKLFLKTQHVQLKTESVSTDWITQKFIKEMSSDGISEDMLISMLLQKFELDITMKIFAKIKEIGDKEYNNRIAVLQDLFVGQKKRKIVKIYYKFLFWFYRVFLGKEKDVVFKLNISKDNSLFLGMMSRVFNHVNGLTGNMFILTSKEKVCELFENSPRFEYTDFSGMITNHMLIEEGVLRPGNIKIYSCPYLNKDSLYIGRMVDNFAQNPNLFLTYDKNSIGQDDVHDPIERMKKSRVYLDMAIVNPQDTVSNFLSLKIKAK